MEALNSLPGAHLRGESQASLEVAAELFHRHREGLSRETAVRRATHAAAMEHGRVDEQALLCSLQRWFSALLGSDARSDADVQGRPTRIATLGFKELLSVRSRSTEYDHEDRLPPARHLPVDVGEDGEGEALPLPRWLTVSL